MREKIKSYRIPVYGMIEDMCYAGEVRQLEKQLVMAIEELKDIPYIPWLDNELAKKIRKAISILKDNQEITCDGVGQCDNDGAGCTPENNCGEYQEKEQ